MKTYQGWDIWDLGILLSHEISLTTVPTCKTPSKIERGNEQATSTNCSSNLASIQSLLTETPSTAVPIPVSLWILIEIGITTISLDQTWICLDGISNASPFSFGKLTFRHDVRLLDQLPSPRSM